MIEKQIINTSTEFIKPVKIPEAINDNEGVTLGQVKERYVDVQTIEIVLTDGMLKVIINGIESNEIQVCQ